MIVDHPFKGAFGFVVHLRSWLSSTRSGQIGWACDACLKNRLAIEANTGLQRLGWGGGPLAYFDQTRTCGTCGLEFVFSAQEQVHWYETLSILVDVKPKNCLKCRRKLRAIKAAHSKLGQLAPPETVPDLLQRAELYEQMGNLEQAVLCLRRAKNKTRSVELREQLLVRIAGLELRSEIAPA